MKSKAGSLITERDQFPSGLTKKKRESEITYKLSISEIN